LIFFQHSFDLGIIRDKDESFLYMYDLDMGCGIGFKVTPYFFKNKNKKFFFIFLHFLLKEKSFEKKNNFFIKFIEIKKL